jgi:hypothetical protein
VVAAGQGQLVAAAGVAQVLGGVVRERVVDRLLRGLAQVQPVGWPRGVFHRQQLFEGGAGDGLVALDRRRPGLHGQRLVEFETIRRLRVEGARQCHRLLRRGPHIEKVQLDHHQAADAQRRAGLAQRLGRFAGRRCR